MTEITAQSIDQALRAQLANLSTSVESREVGTVIQIGDGIARIDGLKDAMAGELPEIRLPVRTEPTEEYYKYNQN